MKRRRVFVIASVILVLVLCTGVGTLAYFTDQKQVTNNAKFGELDVKVHEKIVQGKKEQVGFTVGDNSADCWVRIFVGLPNASGDNANKFDYVIDLHDKDNFNKNWISSGNYYYYTKPVSKGQTVILFDSLYGRVKLEDGQQYSNMNVVIYAEAVQYENTNKTDPVKAFEKIK